MKHLILLRHAKSSWVNPDLEDFDRPLNKRGKRSAKALGKWLRQSDWVPDQILCSSARRARETCEGLALETSPALLKELYHASPDGILKALGRAKGDSVLVVGHNPGIASLAHMLVSEAPEHSRFEDYPTGSLLVAGFDVIKWSQVTAGKGTALAFLTPHDLAQKEH